MSSRIGQNTPTVAAKPLELEPQVARTRGLRVDRSDVAKKPYKGDPMNNPDLDASSRALLQAQQAMFRKNQAVTMASNRQKSEHDTRKAVINNMRV